MNRELHTVPPDFWQEDVIDGRDAWAANYTESEDMENNRISLVHKLNRKMFEDAMAVLRENKLSLTQYDSELFQNLEASWEMAGPAMTLTVKQMNHIKMVAADFVSGAR